MIAMNHPPPFLHERRCGDLSPVDDAQIAALANAVGDLPAPEAAALEVECDRVSAPPEVLSRPVLEEIGLFMMKWLPLAEHVAMDPTARTLSGAWAARNVTPTAEAIAVLAAMPNLQSLTFASDTSHAPIPRLTGVNSLVKLDLSACTDPRDTEQLLQAAMVIPTLLEIVASSSGLSGGAATAMLCAVKDAKKDESVVAAVESFTVLGDSGRRESVSIEVVEALVEAMPSLTAVNWSAPLSEEAAVPLVDGRLSELRHLTLGTRDISGTCLASLSKAPLLKHLDLSFAVNITDGNLLAIAPTDTDDKIGLHTVSVAYTEQLTGAFLACGLLRNVRELDLSYSRAINDSELAAAAGRMVRDGLRVLRPHGCPITGACLESFSACVGKLRELDLGFCENLADEHLAALPPMPQLKVLLLTDCARLQGDFAERVAERCPVLDELDVSRCSSLKASWLRNAPTFPNLRILRAGGSCSSGSAGVDLLAGLRSTPALKQLNLEGESDLNDAAFSHLPVLKYLETVHLGECGNITGAGLQELARAAPGLVSLDLGHCENVTDAGLGAAPLALPALRSLNLEGCPKLTGDALHVLAGTPALVSLDLKWCTGLTDAGVGRLPLASLRRLEVLRMCNSSSLTGASLGAVLATSAVELLDLSFCRALTEDAVAALPPMPALRNLRLCGAAAVTGAFIRDFADRCRALLEVDLRQCGSAVAETLTIPRREVRVVLGGRCQRCIKLHGYLKDQCAKCQVAGRAVLKAAADN